ncbi:MAG TPA: UPF0280 family protein, partial [Firmicutes bacterium]|nr:UPF0280 family protein [Bacillota bacterium]
MAMEGEGYSLRRYRTQTDADLKSFRVTVKETDLLIRVDKAGYREGLVSEVETLILRNRSLLEDYIKEDPAFASSLAPYLVGPEAPLIARRMVLAANPAGVGPMAAVAGVFAALTGDFLRQSCREVIVENGGDIYLASNKKRLVAILAGSSPFNNRLALEVPSGTRPFGVCTSSGSVGPSLSLGRADAAVVLSHDVPLADAVATATA